MTNLIPFNPAKRRPKGHPTQDEILDGHFEDVLQKWRKPFPAMGMAIVTFLVILGTGLPWLLAQLMKGLSSAY